jgi:phage tail-like protein
MVSFDGGMAAYFSELGGISTEVEPVEYIASDAASGKPILTKQFGKLKPPTVTLKRGVDGDASIFAWHEMVRWKVAAARMTGTLSFMGHPDSVGGTSPVLCSYVLEGAWPSKIEVGNLKAGSSEIILETVTFTCESIHMTTA